MAESLAAVALASVAGAIAAARIAKTKDQSRRALYGALLIVALGVAIQVDRLNVQPTYYDALDLPVSATQQEIGAAYKRLSKQYHPDKSSEAGASDTFMKLTIIKETLANPVKRSVYDGFGPLDEAHVEGISQNKPGAFLIFIMPAYGLAAGILFFITSSAQRSAARMTALVVLALLIGADAFLRLGDSSGLALLAPYTPAFQLIPSLRIIFAAVIWGVVGFYHATFVPPQPAIYTMGELQILEFMLGKIELLCQSSKSPEQDKEFETWRKKLKSFNPTTPPPAATEGGWKSKVGWAIFMFVVTSQLNKGASPQQ